jgi:hypothetical protein
MTTQNRIPTEKHLGSQTADAEDAPRGSVLLVEPQHAHREFLDQNPYVSTVLLRITHVQTLVNRGETADTYFEDDVTVITSTTINDRRLAQLGWQEELELIKEFEPDYHIPCDYPVYKAWDEGRRKQHILDCLEGTIWIADRLEDTGTQVIPLLKGETPEEREYCYKVFEEQLGTNYCVFYGTQYFTAGVGFYKLLEDIQKVVSEAPQLQILLMGLQYPGWLEELPPQVVAAAGQRWIRHSQLRDVSWKQAQENYGELDQEIESALETGQAPLGIWSPSNEVTA